MNKQWRVNLSGKIELVLFVYAAMIIALAIELIWDLFDLGEMTSEDFIILAPALVIVVFFPIFFARKKKVPKSITVDDEQLKVVYFRSKHENVSLNLNDISYFTIKKSIFTILIISEKAIATRGHTNHFEVFNIFGLPVSTSWTQKHLGQIEEAFAKAGVEYHKPLNEKNLVDYIFGS
ncbi:MAG: hypothetical protein ACPGLV_10845 [Bacteroidia bacterium]